MSVHRHAGSPIDYGGETEHRDRLIGGIERLVLAMEKNQTVLIAAQQIPMTEVETAVDATGLVTVLSVFPNTSNIVRVRKVVCFIPATASGLLVLGNVQIPVGAGSTNLDLWLTLNTDDVRQLQSTVAGTMSLTVMGDILSRSMRVS